MNITEYCNKQLKPGEDLIRIVRQHPAMMAPALGVGGLLIMLDFFLLTWWFSQHGWGVLGFVAVLLISGLIIARGVFVWSRNALAITSRRIIDLDQNGFFNRNVAEAPFDKIQDIRYTIRGFWSTIFHFGTIVLQTAGTTTNLELNSVKDPMELQQQITDLQRQAKKSVPTDLRASELIDVVHRLKDELGEDGLKQILQSADKKHDQD